MTHKLKLIFKYVHYYLSAQTKHDIHSPFVFNLVTKVFNCDKKLSLFYPIESQRQIYLNDKTKIDIRDFGAGFGGIKYKQKTVSYITSRSAKSKKYARLLYRLTHYLKPDTMLEIGTSVGISAVYQALGNMDGRLITIEGCENTAAVARKTFNDLETKNIKLINEEFETGLNTILKETTKIDYVFIDGNHRKEPTLNYFIQCIKHSKPATVLIIDDINWSQEMQEAWKEIKQHPKATITIDLFMLGIVFINPDFSKENFIIRF